MLKVKKKLQQQQHSYIERNKNKKYHIYWIVDIKFQTYHCYWQSNKQFKLLLQFKHIEYIIFFFVALLPHQQHLVDLCFGFISFWVGLFFSHSIGIALVLTSFTTIIVLPNVDVTFAYTDKHTLLELSRGKYEIHNPYLITRILKTFKSFLIFGFEMQSSFFSCDKLWNRWKNYYFAW